MSYGFLKTWLKGSVAPSYSLLNVIYWSYNSEEVDIQLYIVQAKFDHNSQIYAKFLISEFKYYLLIHFLR